MRRADDLVVLPALPVAVLPGAALIGHHAVPVREPLRVFPEEHQAVDELAHDLLRRTTAESETSVDLVELVSI
jgi:hypothetical protein